MKKNMRNIWLTAENNGDRDGFNIYLSISGQREFLMHHRHNGLLYGLLAHGVRADDLRRWDPASACAGLKGPARKKVSIRLEGMVRHLLLVLDDYMLEREYERQSCPAVAGIGILDTSKSTAA